MSNVRSRRDIDAALCKKGFDKSLKGKHIFYTLSDSDEIKTMMSHGAMSATLGAELISRMARQLHLTKNQFLDLIDCILDEDGYREILSTDYAD